MQRNARLVLALTAITLSLFLVGCGDDDDPVTVISDCTETDPQGSITIDTEPDVIHASWQLSGPNGYVAAGAGDIQLDDLFAGNYAIQWNEMANYERPNPSTFTQYLKANQASTFTGEFVYSGPARWDPVLIPPVSVSMPVTFTMGSDVESDETPHQVTLTRRFNMAATEVTQGEYIMALQWAYDHDLVTVVGQDVFDGLDGSDIRIFRISLDPNQIGFDDGIFSTDKPDFPAADMHWCGAAAYCDWLSLQNDLPRAYDHSTWQCNGGDPYTASGFRLPTEAEWELACRAGTTGPFNTGDCLFAGGEANFLASPGYLDCPVGYTYGSFVDVGHFSANSWGLYDMHGNAFEWCDDSYSDYGGDATDPYFTDSVESKIMRGGSNGDVGTDCRSARRIFETPYTFLNDIGFRVVKSGG